MKAIFIAYNEAYNEEISRLIEAQGQRGFTRWDEVSGRGSVDGEPHFGNHAWPVENQAILTVVPDDKVELIMNVLRETDKKYHDLGLRAYVWNVEEGL